MNPQKHDNSEDGFAGDWLQRGADVDILAGYITRAALAKQLNRDERTLARWAKMRTGPPVTTIGRVPYYRIAAVEAWLLTRETKMVRERDRRRSSQASAA